jgi:hypothetical protein
LQPPVVFFAKTSTDGRYDSQQILPTELSAPSNDLGCCRSRGQVHKFSDFSRQPVLCSQLLTGSSRPIHGSHPRFEAQKTGTFFSPTGLGDRGCPKAARRLRFSTKAAILIEGTSDASNRNRPVISSAVSHGVFDCAAWAVCGPGIGLVEDQQEQRERSQQSSRQRCTRITPPGVAPGECVRAAAGRRRRNTDSLFPFRSSSL